MRKPKRPAASQGIRALAALHCIGPATARMLTEAGIADPRGLRRLGAQGAYRRLRFHFGKRVSASYLYALECALTGMNWTTLRGQRMAALRADAQKIADELDALANRN